MALLAAALVVDAAASTAFTSWSRHMRADLAAVSSYGKYYLAPEVEALGGYALGGGWLRRAHCLRPSSCTTR